MMTLDLKQIRAQFPALDRREIFFDNPGGTQVARQSLERMQRYLLECNANRHGAFATAHASDAILDEAHAAMADLLNADRAEEIVFGPNMTSLTFQISRAISRDWGRGDRIVVTRLDHDANITPWTMAAEERGCEVVWVDFDVETGTLDLDSYARAMETRPRLVAFGYASNALGTVNPVRKLAAMAREAGALSYVDAVQYAPHGPIDVQALGCDFLVCSAYKFFGPHVGALYGRYELLDGLRAYKVRPAGDNPPDKFETGTQNHEGIAGVLGALEYFAWVGNTFGREGREAWKEDGLSGRRMALRQGLTAVRAYEFELSRALLETLGSVPGVTVYGLTDPRRLDERVPTVSFRLAGKSPLQVAEALGKAGFFVWDGNYYALAVTERLGVEADGGMVRVGAVHYNTLDEIERLGQALRKITG